MATSPHLCLRWNNYQTNLTSVFDQLLQSETFVDVTLAADGHAIKAHRMVLSACSPYFQALFFDNPCQHPIVILKDTRWSELKAIVEYMYRGEISVAQEELTSLLRVAETLKIRGLSELNADRQGASGGEERSDSASPGAVVSATPNGILSRRLDSPAGSWPLQTQSWSRDETPTLSPRNVKRRRTSGTERSTPASPAGSVAPVPDDMSLEGPLPLVGHSHPTPASSSTSASTPAAMNLPPSLTIQQQQQQMQPSPADDLDIKPGIAELIREEERARMLEGTHPWLSTPPSVLSGSGQASIDARDALWQKAWATGQGVMQNLRFRERGPFKTWRPETMAEAIMAVLREGLSLSQAARKFDIPYPTFVLYANRVNNMLGPSVEGGPGPIFGAELRPKGRGRPQRILTGSWPEDHVHGVIRAVVFRDPSSLPRHFDRGMEREDLNRMAASKPSISRIITTGPPECSGSSLSASRLNPNNNGNDLAMPSSSANLNFPPFSSMRSMAGPSSSNGVEIVTSAAMMNQNPMNSQTLQNANSNSCLVNSGGGLTSSSLFSVLQQEVAEETRLAALNAMNQRLMSSMDHEPVVSLAMGSSSSSSNGSGLNQQLSCQQQQHQMGWFPGANFNNQMPMVDEVGAADDVEQLASTYQAHNPSAGSVHVKQEQLFGD